MRTVFQYFVLMNVAVLSRGRCGNCDYDLVTGAYGVSDDRISASSTHSHCPLSGVRFSSNAGWCPNNIAVGEYVQVEFQSVSLLKAVQTKGRGIYAQWVSSYSVNISMDGLKWTSISNSTGYKKVFSGNDNSHAIVTNALEGTVIAKYIRVIGVSFQARGSMRMEVKGCPFLEMNSTCHRWGAKLGTIGDVLTILHDDAAPSQGLCGLKCHRQPECISFLFDVTSARCRLLATAVNGSQDTVNLDGVWHFVET